MIKIKQGDTFELTNVLTDTATGLAVDITTWTIRSQIRKSGVLIETLTPTITDGAAGIYTLSESAPGVTTSWEVGNYECDIEYTNGGVVISTETFCIQVAKDITI